MKKRVLALLAACTVTAALVLGGCGQTQTTPDSGNTTGNQGASADDGRTDSDGVTQGYMFESNGVKIAVDVDMNEIKDSLGEPKSVFEEPSCAAQGTAYLYSYSGYEINTYPDGELNRIAYILLKDDTVATMEGVDLNAELLHVYKAEKRWFLCFLQILTDRMQSEDQGAFGDS